MVCLVDIYPGHPIHTHGTLPEFLRYYTPSTPTNAPLSHFAGPHVKGFVRTRASAFALSSPGSWLFDNVRNGYYHRPRRQSISCMDIFLLKLPLFGLITLDYMTKMGNYKAL
ncbi:hypothetical protein CDAR_74961 [Caerostris darwini]|uniref:Uncharacterized protein n=1 Tax=Caerostris darwini TaxID=1538125 RepID=A0AAV4P0G6_9ARAC|nr:hypothetical protein CDAR_74961 [Caerostris darwini]